MLAHKPPPPKRFFETPAGLALYAPNHSTKHVPRSIYAKRAYQQGHLAPHPHHVKGPESMAVPKCFVGADDVLMGSGRIPKILDTLRYDLAARGIRAFFGLQHQFKDQDFDRTGKLPQYRFEKALRESRLPIPAEDIKYLFAHYSQSSIYAAYEEFLRDLRASITMSHQKSRRAAAQSLFVHFPKTHDGLVDRNALVSSFQPDRHPLALSGRKSPSEIRQEFLDTFPTTPYISLTDLLTYFSAVSHCYPSDTDFINAITEPWNLNKFSSTTAAPPANQSQYIPQSTKPSSQPYTKNWGAFGPIALKRDPRVVNKRYEPLMDYCMDMVGVEDEKERQRKKAGRMNLTSSVDLSVEEAIETIKRQLKDQKNIRDGKTVAALGRMFRRVDVHGSGSICRGAFADILESELPGLGEETINLLITHLSSPSSSQIPYSTLLNILRGPLTPFRTRICDQSFDKLVTDGKGFITIRDLYKAFDPSKRTDWLSGAKGRDEVFKEEAEGGFDGGQSMDKITREDYRSYWQNRSATIEDDKAFAMLVYTTFPVKYRHGAFRAWREGPCVGWV
ncbi:hypothetical protein HK097_003773 [Rhizophlyctis rosea]|uniref:EF-hand domain-containing protein n=1 Tax=Rhizophlyctis rosea TaxID=64517 RepID=A0AAD5WXS0_9FUNG|nr:hypothetical protein HK097_003773 [Rhizophlyctis rosea]